MYWHKGGAEAPPPKNEKKEKMRNGRIKHKVYLDKLNAKIFVKCNFYFKDVSLLLSHIAHLQLLRIHSPYTMVCSLKIFDSFRH